MAAVLFIFQESSAHSNAGPPTGCVDYGCTANVAGERSSSTTEVIQSKAGTVDAEDRTKFSSDDVREAQELLTTLGYEPGPADGLWGSRTNSAYRSFLKDAGLPLADTLTSRALQALRKAVSFDQDDGSQAEQTTFVASSPISIGQASEECIHLEKSNPIRNGKWVYEVVTSTNKCAKFVYGLYNAEGSFASACKSDDTREYPCPFFSVPNGVRETIGVESMQLVICPDETIPNEVKRGEIICEDRSR